MPSPLPEPEQPAVIDEGAARAALSEVQPEQELRKTL